MYHALLTNRYLTTRIIPLIAVAAVALCTALVIIVVSVMSGFVDMVRNAGKTLMGDVIVSYPLKGIPHYRELIEQIVNLPEAEHATPVVESAGLLKMPYPQGPDKEVEVVQVWGIEPASFAKITAFEESLHWRPVSDDEWLAALENVARETWEWEAPDGTGYFLPQETRAAVEMTSDPLRRTLAALAPPERRQEVVDLPRAEMRQRLPELLGSRFWILKLQEPLLRDDMMPVFLESGRTLRIGDEPAIVLGMHVSQANERRRDGTYRVLGQGSWWMPEHQVTLTMLPISERGQISEPTSKIFPVGNEVQFGVFAIDRQRVFIPIEVAQEMLELDEAEDVDPTNLDESGMPRVIGTVPARATMILISAGEGIAPEVLKTRVNAAYDALRAELTAAEARPGLPDRSQPGIMIRTWEEQNAQIIGPVEKERNLMRILFSIIYIVCAGLVLVIFWAIVYEKTRDIGILRSIGASRVGVLWIFVRYGLVVGVIGSIVGLGLAWLVVHNINDIHDALGEPFPEWARFGMIVLAAASMGLTVWLLLRESILPVVVMGMITILLAALAAWMMLHRGFLMWDPKVYYFTEIPNHVDLGTAVVTMVGAVVFSVVGALIPAARAGDINPVAALRYE